MNIEKCKVVTYTRKVIYPRFAYRINNIELDRAHSITDLGIIFNEHLTFNDYITFITGKAIKRLGFLMRNCRDFSNINVLKQVYVSLVRPLLEYATIIWSPSTVGGINMIENVQRRCMKYLHLKAVGTYPPRGYPNNLLLEEFNLWSLETRRKYLDTLFVVNLTNGRIDNACLLGKINFRIPRIISRNNNIFYPANSRKYVKYDSPIDRMCRGVNIISLEIDLVSVTKEELRRLYLKWW